MFYNFVMLPQNIKILKLHFVNQTLGIRVLCVEDESIFRSVFSEMLDGIASEILFAENGQKGLEIFLNQRPDLVITDIAMPRMNGLQMLKAIKRIQPEIFSIVTTSYSETEYFLEAIELGVNRFILKPLDKTQFQATLSEFVKAIDLDKQLKEAEHRRKTAEELLVNSELLFRTLFSQAPQAILLLNPETGRILQSNEPGLELTGYSREELLQLTLAQLIGDELAAQYQGEYLKSFGTSSLNTRRTEMALRRKDGSTVITEVSERVVEFSNENVVIGIFTDLTERKKNEQKLAEYQSELEQLVDVRTTELRETNLRLTRELEAKEKAAVERQKRSDLEALMLEISTKFIHNSPENIAETLRWSLEQLCKATRAGKAFIWMIDENGLVYRNYHFLWKLADEGNNQIHNGFNLKKFSRMWQSIKAGQPYEFEMNTSRKHDEATQLYFAQRGVSSALLCPLHAESAVSGIVGLASFDKNVTFDSGTFFLLNMASQIFSSAFLRYESAIALINSEEKAHALLNASTASMLLLDREGKILEVNESASEAFHLPVEILIGRNYFDIHPSAISEKRRPVFFQVFETKSKTTFRDNYKNLSYEHLVYPVFNQDNEVDRVALMTRDITSYVEAQNQIRAQFNFLQTLINGLPNPVYYKDAEDNFIGCNKEFLAITGKARQEIIGKATVYDTINDFDSALNLHNNDFTDKVSSIRYESVVPYHDQTNHTVLFTKSILYGLGGHRNGVIGTLTDITEMKRFEFELKELNFNLESRVIEELRKAEKQRNKLIQKSKLESLGQLAAGMAHEINQPLGGISMSLENILIKHDRGNMTNEYLTSKIDQCFGNISRIKQIIDHIRTFSRDQQNTIVEKVDLLEAVANTLLLIETQYKNQQIRLEINKPDHPLYFFGNKFKLEQVILNLLSNAKDAVEEREKMAAPEKHPKRVIINCRREEATILLSVTDNGIGIENENIDLLFEPFYTTKETNRGTGLGLSIVYGIIKEFNGNINIESKPNQGTTIEIALPASQ